MILLTFGFLGWAWYELSGGSDFVAGQNGVTLLARVEAPETAGEERVTVSRADTSGADLTRTEIATAPRIESAIALPVRSLTGPEAEKTATVTEAAATEAAVTNASVTNAALTDAGPAEGPAATQAARIAAASSIDYRAVSGNRVNLRAGPGTDFAVVTTLVRGDEVEVLSDPGAGWVRLRALGGNQIGWMSQNFLTAAN